MDNKNTLNQAVQKAADQFGLTLYDFDASRVKMPVRLGAALDQYSREQRAETVAIGDFELNTIHHYLIKNDDKITLTEREVDILYELQAANGIDVTRAHLLKSIWNYVEDTETHTLETHVYRLRQKIEDNSVTPAIILTTDNGYKLGV